MTWKKISEEQYKPLEAEEALEHARRQRQLGLTAEAFPEHEKTLIDYTNGSGNYSLINTSLRDKDWFQTLHPLQQDETRNYVAHLDELLEKSPGLSRHSVLYRGLRDGPTAQRLRAAEIGSTIQDLGYMSTSTLKEAAERFAAPRTRYKPEGILMEIEAPQGTKALHTLGFRTGDESIYGDSTREAEMLFRRNTHMQLLSRDGNRMRLRITKQPPLSPLGQ